MSGDSKDVRNDRRSAEPATKIFDRAKLLRKVGGAEDLYQRLLTLFLETLNEQLPPLEEGVQCYDVREIRFRSHTISGVAANIGAEQIHKIAAEMESLVEAGSLEEMSKLLGQLQVASEAFRSFIADCEKDSDSS